MDEARGGREPSAKAAGPPRRLLQALCLLGGVLLAVIGARYLLSPRGAMATFGIASPPAGFELPAIVGLRNLWLGLLAVGLAALSEWRALALWLGLGTLVCLADAGIAAASSGKLPQIAFHLASGAACLVLSLLLLRAARRGA